MRRISALVLFCASLALVGVAPAPKPKPTPTPSPSPAVATPTALPLVVVYPFDISSDLQADTGSKAAQLFVGQMNGAGGVDAILAPATVKRASYLDYAKSINASYYVSGYMTPLGGGVSLVEQVVATQSGTIVFGQTAQIQSLADAAAQAESIRDGIVAREQSLTASIQQSSTQSTPAPMASNEANIGNLASSIFKRRGTAAPTAQTPVAKPAKGIFVVRVAGHVSDGDLSTATTDLFYALNKRFNVRMTGASNANVGKEADGICGSRRDNTIAAGTLNTQPARHGIFKRTEYAFTLDIYTCFGAKLASAAGVGDSMESAISSAVISYAQNHPQNV